MGTLFYGHNPDILRRYTPDETVDLVYLHPPFNSPQTYKALFQEKDGTPVASQVNAFEDTRECSREAQAVYRELTEQAGKVKEVLEAFMTVLARNDMIGRIQKIR